MAMGKRKVEQASFWVATRDLAVSPGNPFYQHLNKLLDKHGFDPFVEKTCAPHYADALGRPSIPPGVYFRMLMIGYFEGIGSERGICWKAADSRSLGTFLGLSPAQSAPTHVSMQNTRNRLPMEVHQEVFTHVLSIVAKEGLLKGKTLGIDATTLEANAALRSIVRKDTGENYQEFLQELARASGVETPTKEDLIRMDRARKGKKTSNRDWEHPHDSDARIGITKRGACDMIHKCEAASDLETGALVAVTVQAGDLGDTATLPATLTEARENLEAVRDKDVESFLAVPFTLETEVVTDKGYHSDAVLSDLYVEGMRTYISEPGRKSRNWRGKEFERGLAYANRRRIRGARGKRLLRKRGEVCERNFAHLFESGGLRRVHVRGHEKIGKRLLIHACGFNLGLVMLKLFGKGTPRGFSERMGVVLASIFIYISRLRGSFRRLASRHRVFGNFHKLSMFSNPFAACAA